MSEELTGEVLHVIAPDALEEEDVEPALARLADSRYVIVCREGGAPSLFGLVWSYLRGRPIEAVTVVSDEPATEGEELTFQVDATEMEGVYRAVGRGGE